MSYATSDFSCLPYTPSAWTDPVRRPNALVLSLAAAFITVMPGLAFIGHQIDQLPRVDPDETPHAVVAYAVQAPEAATKLDVLTPDADVRVTSAVDSYVPTSNAQRLSADMNGTAAAELVAKLEDHPDAVDSEAPATDAAIAGPGQVIEVATAGSQPNADEMFPAFSDQGRLVAVPDDDLVTMSSTPRPEPE